MPEDIVARVDVSRPSVARIYDYWLGGKDNFETDRHEAERVLAPAAREGRGDHRGGPPSARRWP